MVKSLLRKQMTESTFHIYLKDECLFKDLNQKEFDVIWGRIYKSYFKEDISYSKITENPTKEYEESSY